MREKLYIGGEYIPLSKSINPSLTKDITNLEKPSERKAPRSKTTTIPNSPEAQKVFGDYFEFNIATGNFDPTKKVDLEYYVDNLPIILGYCKLKSIGETNYREIEYNIVMYGDIANIFREMGEAYLTELAEINGGSDADIDRWNHVFTRTNQQKSWATEIFDADALAYVPFQLGRGYVYPLIDYGHSTNLEDFRATRMPPAIYVKQYIDSISEYTGYNFQSTFFDSTFFKSLIIPGEAKSNILTESEIDALKFSANTPNFTSTGGTTSNNLPLGSYSSDDVLIFTNELSDPGSSYDNTTGIFAANGQGWFNINALIDVNATFTPGTGTAVKTTCDIVGYIMVFIDGNQVQSKQFIITSDDSSFISGARSTSTTPTYPDGDYLAEKKWSQPTLPNLSASSRAGQDVPDRYFIQLPNTYLQNTDNVTIKVKAGIFTSANGMFVDSGGTYYSGNATIDISVGAYYNEVTNSYPPENTTYKLAKSIPRDVKMKDFFMSLVKLFNLWIDVDPSDDKTLLVEPRDDFLGTDIIDISDKLAIDRQIQSYSLNKLNVSNYTFSYKEDGDYLNQRYKDTWQALYGERVIESSNDFVNKTEKTEVMFAPTPLAAEAGSTRVLSTIIEKDDLGYHKPTKHKIRILYYGGLKDGRPWNHQTVYPSTGAISDDIQTQYPYAGHLDDPFNPTVDLNFGIPKEVYYDSGQNQINYTNNNMVNKYYSKMLRQYTDKDTRIVDVMCNVGSEEWRTWTFDKVYLFKNKYWRLQRISGYNPTGNTLTKCTFISLAEVPDFSNGSVPLVGDDEPFEPAGSTGGSISLDEDTPTSGTKSQDSGDGNSYGNRSNQIDGSYNTIASDSYYVKISGDSNKVFHDAKNVNIQGDNNVIESGVENVTLINTSGVTVDESDVTYINGKRQGYWVEETTSFVFDDVVEGYYLDATSGDLQARLNGSTSKFIVKRVDSTSNRCYLDAGAYTFDNTSAEFDLAPNESIRIRWDETDQTYYIIN